MDGGKDGCPGRYGGDDGLESLCIGGGLHDADGAFSAILGLPDGKSGRIVRVGEFHGKELGSVGFDIAGEEMVADFLPVGVHQGGGESFHQVTDPRDGRDETRSVG